MTTCPGRRLARGLFLASCALAWPLCAPTPALAQDQAATTTATRPMTFLDMQRMRQAGPLVPSPDGRWALHTLSVPDWKEGRRQTDLYLVSTSEGVASTRQMTFTRDRHETSPQWAPDGTRFAFLSNRDAPDSASSRNQLYLMRPDGGEAMRVTDARDGVSDFAFSPDGRWLAYRAGKAGEEQLHRLPVDRLDTEPAEALTKQDGGVGPWKWSPDSRRLYFVGPDRADVDDRIRREKKFTVNVRNQETPLASLWAVDLDPIAVVRLTADASYSVGDFTLSDDGRVVGFRGHSPNRYERNITQQNLYADLYLFDVAEGTVERLTENSEVAESVPSFSPDSRWVAFSASGNLERYSMASARVYLRAVGDRGRPFRRLGDDFDGDVTVAFWSPDSTTIYFNEGWRATTQLFALDVAKGTVRQVTSERAALSATRHVESGLVLVSYSDPVTPPAAFVVRDLTRVGDRAAWTQVTDPNPEVRGFALGEQLEITWRSTDDTEVGGVLVKPVGYEAGRRYPLIVAIHGGPASADVLNFNGGYGSQVYAGAGYVVLRPNYRGSTNYGERHRTAIVGNYFPPGYDDIMAGVDHLIADGLVDPDRMGVLGWSAGGHWSNWILTQTDRFKAISSGAGTSNWISMYAQSDVQRNRQYYLGDRLPYDGFDAYWDQSPLKHITRAKTPTMIHVVEGDPRVPSPQSVELHMALRQLGVPTELFMYPGQSHGIPDPRNQLVKAMSEMAWMDYYVRGRGDRFSWRDVLATLEEDGPTATKDTAAAGAR